MAGRCTTSLVGITTSEAQTVVVEIIIRAAAVAKRLW